MYIVIICLLIFELFFVFASLILFILLVKQQVNFNNQDEKN